MLVPFLLFAVVVVVFLIGFITKHYLSKETKSPVPTIKGLPPTDSQLGNLPDITLAGSLHEFLWNLHDQFGGISSFWYGKTFVVSIVSAEYFKNVQNLFDRPNLLFQFLEPLVSLKSIQFACGEEGKKRYKRYSENFMPKINDQMLPKLNKACHDLAATWDKLPAEEHLPLHEYMMALSIKMITSCHFGHFFKNDKATLRFHTLYERLMCHMDAVLIGDVPDAERKMFEKCLEEFHSCINEIIDVHRKSRDSGDYEKAPLLDTILDNVDDEEEVRGDVATFVIGGFHTTGNVLTWLFYYLCCNPKIQEKVYDELSVVIGDNDLNEAHLKKLEYLTQVVNETLRCSQTAPIAARTHETKEIWLGQHKIPPRTPIITALGVSLHDENYFPDPEKFDPDRFSPENVKERPATSFCPFGTAGRLCPAYKFSMHEVYTAAAILIRKFKFSLATDDEVFPKFGFVTKPEAEIWIQVVKRD